MTKEEFLKLTTIFEMSDEDFDRVNSAYMELEGMDKLEFCKLYIEDSPRLFGMLAGVISRYRCVARKKHRLHRYYSALLTESLSRRYAGAPVGGLGHDRENSRRTEDYSVQGQV